MVYLFNWHECIIYAIENKNNKYTDYFRLKNMQVNIRKEKNECSLLYR